MKYQHNLKKNPCLRMLILGIIILNSCTHAQQPAAVTKPNVVMIFLDDGAFNDFKPFGEPRYPTPNVQTLAEEGTSYYSFYVPQAICSASRAALLTGCYPGRTKVFAAHAPQKRGLEPSFAILAEQLKQNDYSTACFGKWHIGDQKDTRSHARGFDETCGLMYSNDMWLHHPENPQFWGQWPLHYWENGEITIDTVQKEDQKMLTTWYTEKAVDFINRHKNEPFFLYVPHSMPHVPLFVSDKFEGKSGTGLYGDVMMELDWSVGQINQAIKDNGLEENTLFIFIGSDNGPWLSYGDHAGITQFREGKGTSFDGGVRNPCIIKYPEAVAADKVSHRTFASIDLMPTICELTSTPLPENEIDGENVWPLIIGDPQAENPHRYYAFSNGSQFQAVMSGDGLWKLHLPHAYRSVAEGGLGGMPGKYANLQLDTALYDMLHDPFERSNLLHKKPEIAAELLEMAREHKTKFYDQDDL